MFLHHEIRKSSVGGVNRKNLSGFCIRGGDLSGFCIPPKKHLSGFCTPLSGFCIRSYLYLGSGNLNPPLSIIFASLRLLTEGPPFSFPSENRKKQEKTGFQKKNGNLPKSSRKKTGCGYSIWSAIAMRPRFITTS